MQAPLGLLLSAAAFSCVITGELPAQTDVAVVPAEARQFDFWVGDWTVTSADGSLEGTSRIETIANGRGLLEHWTGSATRGNGNGKSLSAWNGEKKSWQQFWIGSAGAVLELTGGLDPHGRMVLRGQHVAGAQRINEKITWTPKSDGSVRQVWERSTDEGRTWRTVFDAQYAKTPLKSAAGASASRALLYLFL